MVEDFIIVGEHIELVKLLKVTGISSTGGEAKLMIEDNEVLVNDEVENRKRRKLIPGDVVKVFDNTINLKSA